MTSYAAAVDDKPTENFAVAVGDVDADEYSLSLELKMKRSSAELGGERFDCGPEDGDKDTETDAEHTEDTDAVDGNVAAEAQTPKIQMTARDFGAVDAENSYCGHCLLNLLTVLSVAILSATSGGDGFDAADASPKTMMASYDHQKNQKHQKPDQKAVDVGYCCKSYR